MVLQLETSYITRHPELTIYLTHTEPETENMRTCLAQRTHDNLAAHNLPYSKALSHLRV